MSELESKYSDKVETTIIILFAVFVVALVFFLLKYATNFDFVVDIVGENYLARRGAVTVFFVVFVLFVIRPTMRRLLYK